MDRTAGWLLAALTATILCFLAATTFAQVRADRIDDLATEIATVAAPSIEFLAEARGDLRRIETLSTLYVAAETQPSARPRLEAEISRMRTVYLLRIEQYLRIPPLPGELPLSARVEEEARSVGALSEQVTSLAKSGDFPAARELVHDELIPEGERAGLTILQAIDLNGARIRERAKEIEAVRKETTRIAYGLDGLSVILAAVAGLIALRGIRQYTRLIEAQRRELAIHNEELELFALRVAHDIRGPLTPVVMALEKGQKAVVDEGSRRMFGAALRSVNRIRDLIEGLLVFAKAGALPDASLSTEAKPVLEGVLEDASAQAEAAEIRLRLEVSPMPRVRCSSAVLSSIASNLVRNAIKFMDDAEVREVVCRIRRVDGKALLEVEDTGPGLSPELAARIFEPYVRAKGSKAPGIGLGLATVKRLATAHGGRVGVEAKRGGGARFWVELPLEV